MTDAADTLTVWQLGGGRSATAPLDGAMEYLRRRLDRVLGLYLVAAAPMTLAMLLLIDEVTAEHRRGVPAACAMLTAATVWRWLWLAALQRRVLAEVRGEPAPPIRNRLLTIVWVRAVGNLLLTWGGLLVLPSLYGLLLSGISGPVVLEKARGPIDAVTAGLGWTHRNLRRITRISFIVSAMAGLGLLAVIGLHVLLLGTVLPSLLGIDTAAVRVTVRSPAWWMSVGWFGFLVFDLYWSVASVMIYDDLQARRLGTDLRVRLSQRQNA